MSTFSFAQANRVFTFDENVGLSDSLTLLYDNSLFQICNNDFNEAQDAWINLLLEMEAYSDVINFDLKGIKLWIQLFWDEDGKIKYIGYQLKPESRFVKNEDLKAFFSSFINNYHFPKVTKKKFNHSGNITFPLVPVSLERD